MGTLSRSGRPDPLDINGLNARLVELEAALDARRKDIHRAHSSLGSLRIRLRDRVGRLHEQLDELESAIEEAELGERSTRPAGDARRSAPSGPKSDALPRFTSDTVRRLFRDVAKTIHPDLARDEYSRDRRHALMIEANKAYATGDEERLRRILDAWDRRTEAIQGEDPQSTRARLLNRIAQTEEALDICTAEFKAIHDSPLGKLNALVDQAAARGHDLIGDMVKRLERDVMVARNRLDAIRSRR